MKNKILILITLLLLPLLAACSSGSVEGRTQIPTGELPDYSESDTPDDIVFTPGGYAYRANVHQEGVANPWPDIPFENTTLGSGTDVLDLFYRGFIETRAGETRNNIIFCSREGGISDSQLTLYAVAVPAGVGLTDAGGGGRPGILLTVLMIEISPQVAPGEYTFEIGIEINGQDYGTVPCTLYIIED